MLSIWLSLKFCSFLKELRNDRKQIRETVQSVVCICFKVGRVNIFASRLVESIFLL